MKRLRAWLTNLAARYLPDVQASLEAARKLPELQKQFTETVKLIREESSGYAGEGFQKRSLESLRYQEAGELLEARYMGGAGPSTNSISAVTVHESRVELKERLWELELALEDRGWMRQLAIAATEFSRYGLQQIILISRLYCIKNPLVKRGVKTSSNYVFGRGFEISCNDEAANEILQEFLEDNKSELGQIALVEKEVALHTDGNVFFAFVASPTDGKTKVRTIDATEIADIITNPDDASEPWFYKRTWAPQTFSVASGMSSAPQKVAWYPALDYEPAERIPTIGPDPVNWQMPVMHMKIGGYMKWKFGIGDVYCAIDWARAYSNFLSHWATITEMLARFSWNLETQGGQQAIAAFNAALGTTLASGGTNIERNPTPVTGAAFVTGPGNKLTPIKTAGATTEPEQGRRIMLMVAAAFGLPETFFGDASTGSLATAQSLDRPTELKFLERQEHWRETLQKLCNVPLKRSIGAPKGKLREARKAAGKNGDMRDLAVIVKFPAVLEHDIKEMVQAIVSASTLDGYSPAGTIDIKTIARLVLAELGYEDVETLVNLMYPEPGYSPEVDTSTPPVAQAIPDKQTQPKVSEALIRAVHDLRRSAERLVKKGA